MSQSLQEHLTETYEVDVESQIALREADVTREDPPSVQRFIIDDEDKANWALRKLARLEADRAAAEEQARLERERIAVWLESQTAKLDREASFFKGLLEQFHRNQLNVDPAKKTIQLPAGTLKARKAPDKVEVLDGFITWATMNDRKDLLRVKVDPDKAAIKDALLKDGEVLEHVVRITGEVRYSVEVTS